MTPSQVHAELAGAGVWPQAGPDQRRSGLRLRQHRRRRAGRRRRQHWSTSGPSPGVPAGLSSLPHEHGRRRHRRISRDLGWYFLRLGALGFGGPIALVGAMHRDLVEQRGWISEEEYREGIALAQLSPGPLAAQLCFYIGYVRGGIAGATLAGLSFVLPSFLMVLALGWAYTLYQGLALDAGRFLRRRRSGDWPDQPQRLAPHPEDHRKRCSCSGCIFLLVAVMPRS